MASVPESLIPLLSEIDAGAMVLTPNHLTCVQLLDWYVQFRQQVNKTPICPSPAIYPVDIWIRQQCTALLEENSPHLPGSTLLDSAHETLIWNEVIRQTPTGSALLNPSATAKAVQETWTLVHLWRISRKELDYQARLHSGSKDNDLVAYLEWSDGFQKFCQLNELATQVEMLEKLIPLISNGQVQLPARLLFCGFKNPPPLYQELLDTLTDVAGGNDYPLTEYKPEIAIQGYPDAASELSAAADWALEITQMHAGAKVGIIIPDLHGRHATIQRTFSRTLLPDETRSLQPAERYPFSMSSGLPLSKQPVVSAALQILQRNNRKPDTLDTCLFLRTVFITGSESEARARAALETVLRNNNMPFANNADLKRLAGISERPFYAPVLGQCLADFDEVLRPNSGKNRSTREWAVVFEQQLTALGWPGERSPDKQETSAIKSWYQLLAEFCRLSTVFDAISLNNAIGLLSRMADNCTIRLQAANNQIQLLTPTEADGLQFTHCRMLGLSEQHWPPAPRPSPFIPYALQKEKGIPDADMNLHMHSMLSVLENIITNTGNELIFSYPENDNDIALKPSMMLQQFSSNKTSTHKESTSGPMHPLGELLVANTSSDVLETLHDKNTIPIAQLDAIQGGTSLIADQAECPFRSFISHRLKTRPLEKLMPGLTPRAAGSLVHLALELFWKQISSQAELLAMDSVQRELLVKEVVMNAIRETRKKHFHTMTERFCELEASRLHELLLQWLEEECLRGNFNVLASECNTTWQHAGISLGLRIDRIDRTEDGELVLIDYKTARNTSVDWEDERPVNPQLMLYCLSTEQEQVKQSNDRLLDTGPVTAVYFAQVNIENTRYTGLSAKPGIYPGTSVEELAGKYNGLSDSATWQNLRQQWELSLGELVEEFLNGNVSITPRNKNSCDHCFVRPVCRIDEVIDT